MNTSNASASLNSLLASLTDSLRDKADAHGVDDARFAAVVSTYRAAEHLHDLAEALAGGLPIDHPDVDLSLRGAMWRLAEMQGWHGLDVLPGQDKVRMVAARKGSAKGSKGNCLWILPLDTASGSLGSLGNQLGPSPGPNDPSPMITPIEYP